MNDIVRSVIHNDIRPYITVIVPSYNHKRYLKECLDSIKNQTYDYYQWIVVDDGSVDGSQDFLKSKQEYYGYELYLQTNKGLSATLTDMIMNHSMGDYIACCASDDKWMTNKLAKQVEYLNKYPDCALYYGRSYWIDEKSNIISDDRSVSRHYQGGMVFNEIITQHFHPPVNYLIKKSVLATLGYYPQGIIAEDFYMNCRISHDYPFCYIPEFLGYYRMVATQKKRDPLLLFKSHEETIELYREEPIYRKAKRLQKLRMFCALSMFSKYKLLSLHYLFKGFDIAEPRLLFVGAYNFLFKWNRI